MTTHATRRHLAAIAAGALAAARLMPRSAYAQAAAAIDTALAQEIAREAYIYAYPLVLMELTRRQGTNHAQASADYPVGPGNRFVHARDFPKPENREVIRPNLDTLYSIAWIELGEGPMVLSMPQTDRYMMLPILSGWSDVFAVPGTRTTGTGRAHDFLLLGPGQRGTQVPQGLEVILAPTRMAWIIGRIQTNGRDDFPNVYRIQEGVRLTPLSAWGQRGYTPPPGRVDPSVDMRTPPPEQVARMDAAQFFGLFARLLKDNPPAEVDTPTLHRMARIGLVAGHDFDLSAAAPALREAFARGAANGLKVIEAAARVTPAGGAWTMPTRLMGAYGVEYLQRAVIAMYGLGANLPEDAIYPSVAADADGRPLDGAAHRYVLRFAREQLPPVDAFWSLTAYDKDGYLIANPLNRFALGDRSGMIAGPDGSIEILLQAENPGGGREANWLPVGPGPFNLTLRLYGPKRAALEGAWKPPPVRRVG